MNTSTAQARRTHQPTQPRPPMGPPAGVQQDFDELAQQTAMVEHLTVPGFLRRIPHRWHFDDITRFGDKLGRVAESMQLAYLTTVDRSLGVIRIFPLPLLKRVYEVMSAQFGWPQIIDAPIPGLPAGVDNGAEALRAHERVDKHLRSLLEGATDGNVQHSIAVVLHWLSEDSARIRKELGLAAED
jgi:hypothetical protein